jgi:hypothetical protein
MLNTTSLRFPVVPVTTEGTPSPTLYFSDSTISGAHTSTGNWQDVTTWGTADHNDFNSLSSGTSIQLSAVGLYLISACLGWSGGGTQMVGVRIVKNATTYYSQWVESVPAGGNVVVSVSGTLVVSSNDTIKIQGFQSNGGSFNYQSGLCFFNIVKIG